MAKTTAAYQIHLHVRLSNVPGVLGALATTVGELGGNIAVVEGFEAKGRFVERGICVNCRNVEHQRQIVDALDGVDGIDVLEWYDRTFRMHEGGKIDMKSLAPVGDADDLSMAYTPGVARVCTAIAEDKTLAHKYTIKKNTVAIVSDGTAVLGLGDIGPEAAMPVMEGKALLFKEFAGVDAFPICLDTKDPEEIIETVQRLAPTFGGINLEDIASPGAFEIEERLDALLDIPVFHDDQHGTAVVTLAALANALKLTDKKIENMRIVISGVGAAGVAIGKILLNAGAGYVIGVDRQGAIWTGRDDLNKPKQWFAENTNQDRLEGSLADIMRGTDVFVGVSAAGLLKPADIRSMNADPIVFAMANPDPEITPEDADGLAAVMATGRSDYPNQINNVLAFPGIFRGALDAGATTVTENMKLAAAIAIAESISEEELHAENIIPSVFDRTVVDRVAPAVADAARADGVTRHP